MITVIILSACGAEPGTGGPGGAGSGASNGASNSGGATSSGPGPGPSDCAPFCAGQVLMGCQNGQTLALKTCGEQEFCDDTIHDCNCVQGTTRCLPGDNAKEQVCTPDTGGKNGFDTVGCEAGELCVNGGCEPCNCECLAGDIECAEDGDTVRVCQSNGSGTSCGGSCGIFQPNIKCSQLGMANGCVPPPPGTPAGKVEQFCLNECNTRGVPLDGELCAAVPGLLCAVLICNATGTGLVPDHTDCRDGGKPCGADEQCASCNCQNGQCLGSFVARCGPAIEQCP